MNLVGAMNGAHAALPHMLRRGRGVIVNVSSIGGRVPIPFAAAYTASKYGVAGFTEALRDELAVRSSMEVCGVYPGYVDTPTNLHSANHTGRTLRPVPPVLDPEDVAEGIVGLALRGEGGFSASRPPSPPREARAGARARAGPCRSTRRRRPRGRVGP